MNPTELEASTFPVVLMLFRGAAFPRQLVVISGICPFFPPFPMANDASNKPIKVIRFRGISASIFRNEAAKGDKPFYKVAIQRTFRQGNDYRTTNSFSRDDLPIVRLLAEEAWHFVLTSESDGASD